MLQSMGVHGNWQIYVGCWTFTGGWYSCSVDIHPEGAEGVYLYYLCGICSRFACYVCFFSFRTLISQSIMKMICAFFLILIGIFSFLLPYILACLKGGSGASGRVLPPVTGRYRVRVGVSSHCTSEGKACH